MPAPTPLELILASLDALPSIGALAKASCGEDVSFTRELATALERVVGQALGRGDLDEERDAREQRR